MTATHNGTCQACGRSQAHSGTMAKHGYTTKYGFFMGTCSGSDRPALELATDHNIATVAAINEWADEQDAKSHGEIKSITISRRRQNRTRFESMYEDVQMTREEWLAAHATKIEEYADENTDAAYWTEYFGRQFDEKVDDVRSMMRRNATSARKDAVLLDELRDKTFGNELELRHNPDAPKSHRESFTCTKSEDGRFIDRANAQAYDRQRELKEQGIRSRVTGDARYATITFKK